MEGSVMIHRRERVCERDLSLISPTFRRQALTDLLAAHQREAVDPYLSAGLVWYVDHQTRHGWHRKTLEQWQATWLAIMNGTAWGCVDCGLTFAPAERMTWGLPTGLLRCPNAQCMSHRITPVASLHQHAG